MVDDNVMSIDVLPTIADTLGVEAPWDVDDREADEAGERDQDVKYVDDDEDNYWRAEDGESLVRAPGTRARPWAAAGCPTAGTWPTPLADPR